MKKKTCIAACLSVVLLITFTACPGRDAGEGRPVTLEIATMGMGSAWFAYGAILSELITGALPPGSRVNIAPEAGAFANPILVSRGEFPMGIGFNLSTAWAYNGEFAYDTAHRNLRGLVGYMDTMFYAAVVSRAFGITDLAEVARNRIPIRVSTVPVGGLGEIVTRMVFEYYGFTYADIKAWGGRVEHNDFSTIIDMFKDGQTDFFLQNINVGHAAVTELAITTPVIFLRFPDSLINSFVSTYGFTPEIIPANSFRGQTEDIPTIGLTSILFTNTDMPDDVAYAVVKGIVENYEAMQRAHAAMARFSPHLAADPVGLGVPLHPGAERFFRGAGLLP